MFEKKLKLFVLFLEKDRLINFFFGVAMQKLCVVFST